MVMVCCTLLNISLPMFSSHRYGDWRKDGVPWTVLRDHRHGMISSTCWTHLFRCLLVGLLFGLFVAASILATPLKWSRHAVRDQMSQKTGIIVFTIWGPVKWSLSGFDSMIFTKISLLAHVIYSSAIPQYTLSNDLIPKKNAPCITNILNVSTNPIPLSSPFTSPSSGLNFISVASLLAELAYLYVLFILQLTAGSVRQIKNE